MAVLSRTGYCVKCRGPGREDLPLHKDHIPDSYCFHCWQVQTMREETAALLAVTDEQLAIVAPIKSKSNWGAIVQLALGLAVTTTTGGACPLIGIYRDE